MDEQGAKEWRSRTCGTLLRVLSARASFRGILTNSLKLDLPASSSSIKAGDDVECAA